MDQEEVNQFQGLSQVSDLYRLHRARLVDRVVELENELRALRDQLQVQQITDTLTGLANRDYFFASLTRLWRRALRFAQPVCMALVNVDRFRQINEQHGRQAGDLVLTGVADALRSIVRDYDLLARYGDNEFAVAVDNADAGTASQLGQRIRQAVAAMPFCLNDRIVPVTVTVGTALGRPERSGDSAELLVRTAVEAIEIARHKGHNQHHARELGSAGPNASGLRQWGGQSRVQ